MLHNAFIRFEVETGGGYDASRNPIPTTKTLSAYILCNSRTIQKEYKVFADGQYVQAKYSIYVEELLIPAGVNVNTVKAIQLQDFNGNDLGKYLIHEKKPLSLTNQVKLIV